MTNKRLTKTLEALKRLHNCNENTKIDAVFFNNYTNEVIVLFTNKRKYRNPFNYDDPVLKEGTFNEYVSFNNRYVWGCRVGYFCGVEEQIQHFNSLENYKRIQ